MTHNRGQRTSPRSLPLLGSLLISLYRTAHSEQARPRISGRLGLVDSHVAPAAGPRGWSAACTRYLAPSAAVSDATQEMPPSEAFPSGASSPCSRPIRRRACICKRAIAAKGDRLRIRRGEARRPAMRVSLMALDFYMSNMSQCPAKSYAGSGCATRESCHCLAAVWSTLHSVVTLQTLRNSCERYSTDTCVRDARTNKPSRQRLHLVVAFESGSGTI